MSGTYRAISRTAGCEKRGMFMACKITRMILALTFALCSAQQLGAQVTADFTNIKYAFRHVHQKLDIYLPPNAPAPYPVIVWIHGGGWQSGDKSSAAFYAGKLVPQGFAVVGINYRLSGSTIFPAQIYDCKAAIRWIRANAATYQFDSTRIGVWGSSAGGHLAALLGTSGGVSALEGDAGGNLAYSSHVQAVVDFFGPTDLLNIQLDVRNPPGSNFNHDSSTSPESQLIGFRQSGQGIGVLRANQTNPNSPYPQKMTLINLTNPINYISADDPPFYIAHGTADKTVPNLQSARLANALAAAGVVYRYDIIAGAGHSMPASVDTVAVNFFKQQFLAP